MLKPVQFLKPCNVNGPLYQAGDVAGFMPELVAELVANGTVREVSASEPAEPSAAPEKAPEPVGTFSGFPRASSEERQAARKNRKPRR